MALLLRNADGRGGDLLFTSFWGAGIVGAVSLVPMQPPKIFPGFFLLGKQNSYFFTVFSKFTKEPKQNGKGKFFLLCTNYPGIYDCSRL